MSAAKRCRQQGWKPGTRIIGTFKGEDNAEFRITAIGESAVLARRKGAMEYAHHDLDGFEKVEKSSAPKS